MKFWRLLCAAGCVCSVAVAAAPLPVWAQDWVGSESEVVGSFNQEDLDNYANEIFEDFVEDLSGSGFDLVSPTPSGSPVIEVDPDQDKIFEEDILPVPSIMPDFSLPDGSFDNSSDFFSDDDIDPLASYNTYYGSIGSTYLEYMRGFLPKLGFRDHYVCARISQYNYIFAYGDLEFTGSLFRGYDINVVTFSTYNNGSYSYAVESSFNLNPSGYMVYSDLSDIYPSLADSGAFTSRQILMLLIIMGLVWTIDHMYQVRKIRRLK